MIVNDKIELEILLKKDIDRAGRTTKIFAGHLPLVYVDENGKPPVVLDEKRWGEFSAFTFDLGAKLVRYSLDSGLESKLMIVVDDDIELTFLNNKLKPLDDKNWKRKCRRKILKMSLIPSSFEVILKKYGLSYEHLVTQYKKGVDTVLISEKKLKTEARKLKLRAPNKCSLAYKGLLFNDNSRYFNQNKDFHIGFLPGQCKGNICEGIIDSDFKIEASFVFFPHIEDMGGLIPARVGYTKSSVFNPLPSHKWFENNQISYLKTTHNNGNRCTSL